MKTALTRARQRLLPKVFESLRRDLSLSDWEIASEVLIARRDPNGAATALGMAPELVRVALKDRIVPLLRTRFGADSMDVILRLTGRARR